MNLGDIEELVGTVTESRDDLTLEVDFGTFGQLPDVHPEAITPLRWRPDVGARVRCYRRMGDRVTWVGIHGDPDVEAPADWQLPAKLALLSERGDVGIHLEDGAADEQDQPRLRVGHAAADSPAVCGTEYKGWAEDLIDHLKALDDEVERLRGVVGQVVALRKTLSQLEQSAWNEVASGLSSIPAPSGACSAAAAAHGVAIGGAIPSMESTLSTIQTNLSTVKNDLQARRDEIDDHLSDYVFVSKAPSAASVAGAKRGSDDG